MIPSGPRHIFLSCGEASGDRYGAALTAALRSLDPDLRISALGGAGLADCGCEMVAEADELAVMGFSEVVGALPAIMRTRKRIWAHLAQQKPDLVVLIDFPDPHTIELAKLYSVDFYVTLAERLAPGALIAIQSTSPFFAKQTFLCIGVTLRKAGLSVLPYHDNVPSFGEWGFVLVTPEEVTRDALRLTVPTRYLTNEVLAATFSFPADMSPRRGNINRLNDPVLVRLYERGWNRFND